jgi:ribosomal protein S27E
MKCVKCKNNEGEFSKAFNIIVCDNCHDELVDANNPNEQIFENGIV